jgi:hypothetical protein
LFLGFSGEATVKLQAASSTRFRQKLLKAQEKVDSWLVSRGILILEELYDFTLDPEAIAAAHEAGRRIFVQCNVGHCIALRKLSHRTIDCLLYFPGA